MYRHFATTTLFALLAPLSVMAGNSVQTAHTHLDSNKKIVFPASKGDVTFDHERHVRAMKSESCIPCHRTDNPTPTETMTRFDARTAHYFCKGCHREKGMGPIECHECHKQRK